MLFSGLTFLYYFLPAVLIAYFLVPDGWKNGVLLFFSLFFYAWGEPKLALLMVVTILVFYLCGLAIGRANGQAARKRWMIVSVAIGLGLLGLFKYADFFIGSVNAVTGLSLPLLRLVLPIGISFYTFQCISYTVDVYRGDAAAQKNPISFGCYVSLFPQLIAGPIVRYTDVARALEGRTHSMEAFTLGLRRFLFGLGKKVLLANQFGALTTLYRDSKAQSVLYCWLYALAFALQIYFDFSGYSDMAIGLGQIFGFRFPENFNYPYLSRSITEFWRRWHMTLGGWFRDYVYIPLGGNRVTRPRWFWNILAVWMLTGLWHGASWNFVLWGGYYAALLILEKCWLLKAGEKLPLVLRRMMTMVLVMLGWALFYFEDLGALGAFLGRLFTAVPSAGIAFYLPVTALGCLCATPALKRVKLPDGVRWGLCVVLLLLCVASLARQSYNPFIYFRF